MTMQKLMFDVKHRNFQRLWLAQLISQFGDRINQFALIGLIAERNPGSSLGLAKVFVFTIIPVFLIQPFAGVFVDRYDRKTTLFISDLARGFLVLLIPLIFIDWELMIPVYGIVFCTFCFSRFYVPAKMSIIPDLVSTDNLLQANSLVTTTGMIAFVLGTAVGGFLIENYGARMGFLIDSATFFVSAVFLFSLKVTRKLKINTKGIRETAQKFRQAKKTFFEDIKDGFIYLKNHRELRFIMGTFATLFTASGATYVTIIVFVQKTFNSVARDFSILAVCLGVGMFLGTILYGKLGKKTSGFKTIFLCLVLGGLMLILFALITYEIPKLIYAGMLSFGLGLVVGPIFIAANTLTQLVSDEDKRGKVFSAMEIVTHSFFLAAMLISSWVSQFIHEVFILVAVGAVVLTVGVLGSLRVKDLEV